MFWDFHESKRYPCTQKISSLALKLTILGLKNFLGKMLILGTPFQPLCHAQYIIRQGKAELLILELTSMFHHLLSVGPKQLCALAPKGCTQAVGIS